MANPILLTGANGYLGSAVAARLNALQLDWSPLSTRLEQLAPASLSHALVIHCAGALRHRPDDWQRSNVDGLTCLLAALRRPARMVMASSRSVYGPAPGGTRLSEDGPLAPRDGYGASKLAAEGLLRASQHLGISARLSTLFGYAPRGDCRSMPNVAMQSFQRHGVVRLVQQDVTVDYLAVADAARILVEIALRPDITVPVINLAGPPRSLHGLIGNLAEAYAGASGHPPSLAYDFAAGHAWPCLDTTLLTRLLPDFEPTGDRQTARVMVELGR
jgi:UDP-glucose 4-epimerase